MNYQSLSFITVLRMKRVYNVINVLNDLRVSNVLRGNDFGETIEKLSQFKSGDSADIAEDEREE